MKMQFPAGQDVTVAQTVAEAPDCCFQAPHRCQSDEPTHHNAIIIIIITSSRYHVVHKIAPFYFCNNFVKPWLNFDKFWYYKYPIICYFTLFI